MPFVDDVEKQVDVIAKERRLTDEECERQTKETQARIAKVLALKQEAVSQGSIRNGFYAVGPGHDVYDALRFIAKNEQAPNRFEFHLLGQVLKYVIRALHGNRFDESIEKAKNILMRIQEHAS